MDIKASYLSILRELSSVEVKILDLIYQDLISTQKLLSDVQFDSKIIAQRFNISIHDMYAKVDNLKRLQLIESPAVQ